MEALLDRLQPRDHPIGCLIMIIYCKVSIYDFFSAYFNSLTVRVGSYRRKKVNKNVSSIIFTTQNMESENNNNEHTLLNTLPVCCGRGHALGVKHVGSSTGVTLVSIKV